jgi:hypothetical protein
LTAETRLYKLFLDDAVGLIGVLGVGGDLIVAWVTIARPDIRIIT